MHIFQHARPLCSIAKETDVAFFTLFLVMSGLLNGPFVRYFRTFFPAASGSALQHRPSWLNHFDTRYEIEGRSSPGFIFDVPSSG